MPEQPRPTSAGDLKRLLGAALPTIRGDGVELRALGEDDVPALFEIFGDAEVARYWSRDPFASLEVAREFLGEIQEGFATGRLFQWGILPAALGRIVGTCTLFQFDLAHRRCEIGFALGRAFWGRGIASNAVASVLRFAFEELQLHRVEADADPRNARSLALLERLGFRREGVLRERYLVNGELQDAVVLGLLASERRL
ncbi:MAG TPA: GNAT family N-acetyltransferase [Polyangiaceae bacterium]